MARSFTGATDRAENQAIGVAPAQTGTISCWIRPNWSSGSGVSHVFWDYSIFHATLDSRLSFVDNSANTIKLGWLKAGGADDRLSFSDTGIFSSGVWANHVYTWNYSTTSSNYLLNGVSKASSASIPNTSYITCVWLDIGNFESGSGGGSGSNPANAAIADFCCWNVVLTAGEINALVGGLRPYSIRPASIICYCPLDGLQSPELDLSGNKTNLTLTGTALANGPPVTMFTPRWPRNYDPSAAASFIPAWAIGSNLPVLGTGTY